MFGYVEPDKDSLTDGQRGLNQSFMCGLCLSTKNIFGNLPRMTIGNDVNFFNVLFHSYLNVDVKIAEARCISHPVQKRSMVESDELCDKLAVANILLTYLNVADDVADSGKKKLAERLLRKTYRAAEALQPTLAAKLTENCRYLDEAEKHGEDNLDKVSHYFSEMSRQFAEETVGKGSLFLSDLCYNVGKWIYLMDALDDFEKDVKSGNYNAFAACFKVKDKSQLRNFSEDAEFVLYSVLNRIAQCYNDLNLTKYTCILDSVIYKSMRNKTKKLIDGLKGA